jgi:8-oxo-dGTP diphosphatase
MKPSGCSILFVNDKKQVLLFLRDEKPDIPFPGIWDIPGGHLETGETPEQCIVREMKEEMDIDLNRFEFFMRSEFSDRVEYLFWKKANLIIDSIDLTEGQRLRWFTRDEVKSTKLAYNFNTLIEKFYKKAPFEATA